MAKVELKSADEFEVPKKKDVFIDGEKVGDVRPQLENDTLIWWAVITMCSPCLGLALAQGRDVSPKEAIRKAMINYQIEINNSIEALKQMQIKLGLTADNRNK